MEDSQAQASTNKLEVAQMVGIDARERIDLEGIAIIGIFKQSIERIEYFIWQKGEKFSIESISIQCESKAA